MLTDHRVEFFRQHGLKTERNLIPVIRPLKRHESIQFTSVHYTNHSISKPGLLSERGPVRQLAQATDRMDRDRDILFRPGWNIPGLEGLCAGLRLSLIHI